MQFALAASGSLAARLVQAAALESSTRHGHSELSALTAPQRAMVALLAELIIPRTDTPGAAEAGVPGFIDHIVTSWYTAAERRIFINGLTKLEGDSVQQFGRGFAACDDTQRAELLSAAESVSIEIRKSESHPGMDVQDEPEARSPFFYKLKELTVLGYYTSELGSTTELNYNPVPGHFEGDVDFQAAGGRQWSW